MVGAIPPSVEDLTSCHTARVRHGSLIAVVLISGCSSKESQSTKGSARVDRAGGGSSGSAASPPRPAPRDRLSSVTTDGSVRITDVSFLPLGTMEGPVEGEFAVSWKGGSRARADVKCRVHGMNLVTLSSPASDDSQAFYPDPFDGGVPDACEVRWFVEKRDDDGEGRHAQVVARACYRAGALTDGPCPDGSFPAPTLPTGTTVAIKPRSTPSRFPEPMPPIQLNQDTVQMSALATVATKLERRPHVTLTCQQGTQVGTTSDRLGFVDLHRLEAGETLYSWSWLFHGDSVFEAMTALDRCQLTVFARDPKTARKRVESLGTFCIQGTGETTAGACVPPLGR